MGEPGPSAKDSYLNGGSLSTSQDAHDRLKLIADIRHLSFAPPMRY
jgi:hypothetical protein